MTHIRRAVVVALGAAWIAAVPATAQRALVVGGFGGGYTHINNLNSLSGQTADFGPGWNAGVTVGVQLSDLVSLHSDFTLARSKARGATSFADAEVSRFFYGAHAELAYRISGGLKGYAFGGGGVVHVSQSGGAQAFTPFDKPAGLVGLGMFLTVPGTNLDVMLEGKSYIYQFDRGGFDRTLWDVTYSAGLAYRVLLP